jgi:hypothetical protein
MMPHTDRDDFVRNSVLEERADDKIGCNICERRCLLGASGTGCAALARTGTVLDGRYS